LEGLFGGAGDVAMKTVPIPLTEAMRDADFVPVNDIVFETDYLRLPDDSTAADDVVMEFRFGESGLTFVREELDGAEYVGEGLTC
jgi:hypothetical protein